MKPADAVKVADAIVRVFIAHGDRTDRKKARLKYVLDAWGFDKFLAEVETVLGAPLQRLADARERAAAAGPARARRRAPQKQPGLVWVGVSLPVGDDGRTDARARRHRAGLR